MEHLIRSVGLTPLTYLLSFHIMEMNAKSRNVGRTFILLNLRKAQDSPPSYIEDPYQTWRLPLPALLICG